MARNQLTMDRMAYSETLGDIWTAFQVKSAIPESDRGNSAAWIEAAGIPSLMKVPAKSMVIEAGKPPRMIEAKGAFHVIRSDNYEFIAQVGRVFKLFQPSEGFKMFDQILPDFGGNYATAGSFNNGGKVWISVELPESIVFTDKTRRYLFLNMPNDGTGNVTGGAVSQFVRCCNTYAMSIAQSKDGANPIPLKIRHAGDMEGKIDDAITMIRTALFQFESFKDRIEGIAEKAATMDLINGLWENVIFPMPEIKADKAPIFVTDGGENMTVTAPEKEAIQIRRRNESREIYNAITNEEFGKRGQNAFAAFQIATGFVDHGVRMQKSKRDVSEKRLVNSIIGNGAEIKEKALDYIVANV